MRIGDLDSQVGQLEAALKHYDDALPLQRNLVATSDAVAAAADAGVAHGQDRPH